MKKEKVIFQSHITILYQSEVFHSEEEFANFKRSEKLDFILNDIEIPSDQTIKIKCLKEYDNINI